MKTAVITILVTAPVMILLLAAILAELTKNWGG